MRPAAPDLAYFSSVAIPGTWQSPWGGYRLATVMGMIILFIRHFVTARQNRPASTEHAGHCTAPGAYACQRRRVGEMQSRYAVDRGKAPSQEASPCRTLARSSHS